jgi:hypothetical protein
MPPTPATPAPPARDLRVDIVRGWMQISIFVSHVAGTAFAWGIHAAWGPSDSSEQFVLLSGLTLGSVFALKAARGGFGAARADMARRTLRLYGTHLTVFFMFAALVLAAEMVVPLPGEVERLGWSFLAERPWLALPAGAAMVYQPAFMGILPVFIWSMLALPAFLWLAGRVGWWALAPAAAAYAAVQVGPGAIPSAGGTGIAFEPLAWQVLFLGGALVGRRALLTGEGVPRRWWLVLGAAAVVLAGLAARLVEHGFIPARRPRSRRPCGRRRCRCRACCTRSRSPTSSRCACRGRPGGCGRGRRSSWPRSGGTACGSSASGCSWPGARRPRSRSGRGTPCGSTPCWSRAGPAGWRRSPGPANAAAPGRRGRAPRQSRQRVGRGGFTE